MPAAVPPHKPMEGDPGPHHRLELCRLATTGDERFAVSSLELDRGGPSFTVDTLRALHEAQPENELTFIVGGDMAASLPQWHEPESVLELATVAVAERGEDRRERIVARLQGLSGRERVVFFDMAPVDVSSSEVRRLVAEGGPFRDLVPDAVARYIEQHGLYRTEVPIA